MPTSPFIDANGATAYRRVSGTGTQADPFISDINIVSMPSSAGGDRFLLIPKSASDITITSGTLLTLDVKALKRVSLTIRNLGGTNPLTGFQVNGTRGSSYSQSMILASTNGDFTTLTGMSSGNPHARIIEASINPRTLAPSTSASVVIRVDDIASLVISASSASTTVNYEGIGLYL